MAELTVCGSFDLWRVRQYRSHVRKLGVRTLAVEGLLLFGFLLTCSFLIR
jgi:hypothetical protein